MKEEKFKKAIEADVKANTPFRCKIGDVTASLGIHIEPDPHEDGKGTCAHFHTIIRCPKIKVVDSPEPDRCKVTNETCPFWEAIGGYGRDSPSRKWIYAHKLIHSTAFVEFYGTQLVNMIFKSKDLDVKGNLRLFEINRLLVISNSIGRDVYRKLEELRDIRNKLAHKPKKYLEFEENKLFESIWEANKISDVLRRRLNERPS